MVTPKQSQNDGDHYHHRYGCQRDKHAWGLSCSCPGRDASCTGDDVRTSLIPRNQDCGQSCGESESVDPPQATSYACRCVASPSDFRVKENPLSRRHWSLSFRRCSFMPDSLSHYDRDRQVEQVSTCRDHRDHSSSFAIARSSSSSPGHRAASLFINVPCSCRRIPPPQEKPPISAWLERATAGCYLHEVPSSGLSRGD
jgi:hypothetical protein